MAPLVTVVIPVKNGESRLGECLASVFSQKADFDFEVLCVDSGSTDGSLSIIQSSGARLLQIPPAEFGHGRTRNFAIAHCRSEFVAMLTQDAVPNDDRWLAELIQPMRDNDKVAGVFGRHLPHPGCNPSEAYMLDAHFRAFGEQVTLYRIAPGLEGWAEYESRRGWYQFFSDNNAALRRSVWERIPYRDVEFMEDQLWASDILEAGYIKAYAPNAAVRHSHDYSLATVLRRAFDEARFRREYCDPGDLPGARALAVQALRDAGRDLRRLARDQAYSTKDRLELAPYIVGRHLAQSAGRFLGDRFELMPETAVRRLSQHHELKGDVAAALPRSPVLRGAVREAVRRSMQTHGKLNTATLGLRKSIWAVRSLRDRGISRTLISLKRELASSDEKATSWWEQWPYRWIDQCAEAPRPRPLRRTPPDPAHLEINWVIPGFSRGSGGHMTIFRMVSYLERFGHKQRVYIQDPAASGLPSQPVHLQALVQDWFLPIQSPVLPLDGEMEPADIAMATGWTTAYSVRQTQCAPVKVYFIQDYESSFYPAGSESQFAENTYHFGFYAITAGRWLERLMRDQYKMVTRSFPLAVEHRDFWPQAEKRSSSPKVVAYIRPATPRRAYELVALALRRIHQAVPDVEIHVLGAELGPSALPVPFVSHGIIGTSEMRRLFSACDVGICVSMTNYSLLPQEMAACGCAVVDLDGDNNRTVYPPGAIALAEPTPEGLAGEVIRLLKDPVALHQQKSAGLDYVRTLSWEKSARLVEAALREFALGAQDEDSPRVAREAAGTRQH